MRKVLHYGVLRPVALMVALVCLALWHTPPGWAFAPRPRPPKTQTPDAEQRREIEARQARERKPPEVRVLSKNEMAGVRGRGQYRNKYFQGVLPWQRSFRDVNFCNGNLFKSFTDIQVPPARGAGLAFQ